LPVPPKRWIGEGCVQGLATRQREIVQQAMDGEHIPGVAVAMVRDGQVAAAEAFGSRRLGPPQPMTVDTTTPIASLSKSFTALAIMQLVEAGRLHLDEPVQAYLPAFRLADAAAAQRLTPRMLLGHRSGLGRVGFQTRVLEEPDVTPYPNRAALVAQLATAELQCAPNLAWSYSNEGYGILGALVDARSGSSLEQHLNEQVFTPLGLTQTCHGFAGWRGATDHAQGYLWDGRAHRPSALPRDYTAYGAGGGVCSSAVDYARYLAASLDLATSPLLSAGGLDQMQTVATPYGDTGWGYGFGWEIAWSGGRKVLHHGGGLPGHTTYALAVPAERFGVVVLTNGAPAETRRLAEALADAVRPTPLWRASPEAPLPFRTRYPVPAARALVAYAGSYRQAAVTIAVAPSTDGLILSVPGPNGRTDSLAAVAVGPDLFLTRRDGRPVRFLRETDGRVAALLASGDRYLNSY
jgi:CubicO group peptidase (beta-lactamase class C family)